MNNVSLTNMAVSRFRDLHVVGKFFIAIFLIVLLEGAIRKWVWGGATIPLLFLRDLLVVVAVTWGLLHRKFNFRAFPEQLLLVWTALVVFWTSIQMLAGMQPPIVGVLGIRAWVLYFWFVVLCMRTLSWADVEYLMKWLGLTIIVLAPLVVVQFLSPVTAFINKSPSSGEVFTVVFGIVRPTATFSFTAGYTTYLAVVLPVIFAFIGGGLKGTVRSSFLKLVLVFLFFIAVLLSGSRGALLSTIVLLSAFFFAVLLLGRFPRPSPKQSLMLVLVLPVVLYFMSDTIEKSIDANQQRIEAASNAEDTTDRILETILGSERIWDSFEPLGHGIGIGSNAAAKFLFGIHRPYLEWEIDRIVYEGGVIALLFALLRVLISVYGLMVAFKIWKNHNEVLPFAIWLVLGLNLYLAPISAQISIHAEIILLLALGAAALTSWGQEKKRRLGLA